MPQHSHVVLPGSRRPRVADATRVGDVDPQAPIELTLTLRGPDLPEPGEPVSREDFARDFSASQADVDAVRASMERAGLTVEDASAETRSVTVSGSAEQVEAAFRPGLGIYHSAAQGEYRGREGQLQVPAELAGIVTGVFGIDERRVAHRRAVAPVAPDAAPAAAPPGMGPKELETHYNFPPGDAKGQTIAIAEFGGGVLMGDLDEYCGTHGRPVPHVRTVGVAGAHSLTVAEINALPLQQRRDAIGASEEVMLDVEIVAGLCPAAEIVVYFAPFTQKGWVDLINAVIKSHPTAVTLSISWGLAEDDPSWMTTALTEINDRLRAAAVLGITVCVASGDDGSGDQMNDSRAHVDFPSGSPNVLSVGGTELDGATEVVWWDAPGDRAHKGGSTGGGVSDHFARPAWQDVHVASLNKGSIDGRVIPDVAALARAPGYSIVFNGTASASGGTSASTPLWASLIARIAAANAPRKVGFLTPRLYADGKGGKPGAVACKDITSGDNRSPKPGVGYQAGPGFDAVSGWGVPDGQALQRALS
jgi:kumamolisin